MDLKEALKIIEEVLSHYKTFKNLKDTIEAENVGFVERERPKEIKTKLRVEDGG